MQKQTITVEDTNTQAFESKLSIINKGYLEDNFAKYFLNNFQKKDVIMHRGYWSRVSIMRSVVEQFLQATKDQQKKQIISFGAGYDTMFFNLKNKYSEQTANLHFYEIDLPSVIQAKIEKIKQHKELQQCIKDYQNVKINEVDSLHAADYTVFSCDIREIDELFKKFSDYNLDLKSPTLIFIECVMAYIEPKKTNELFNAISTKFDFAQILDYEMFNAKDQFGRMMVKNFEIKGCPLVGICEFETLEQIKERYKKLGFNTCEIYKMLEIYNKYVDQTERARIEKIEFLDELEEWNIMQSHYFVSLATCLSEIGKQNKSFEEIISKIQINSQQ